MRAAFNSTDVAENVSTRTEAIMTFVGPSTAEEWLEAIHRAFFVESDRSAAIVAAAMLDDALKCLLTRRLVPAVSRERSIVEGANAPLATFSARIDACHQLGLVSRQLARDLHLIRKIRNHFAHNALVAGFDARPVRDWVNALAQASDMNNRNPTARAACGPPGPRGDYLAITSWILYDLHRQADSIDALAERGPEFGYIDWSRLPPDVRRALEDLERSGD